MAEVRISVHEAGQPGCRNTVNSLLADNGALAALIRASPQAIIGLDADLRVTAWNPAAERIFGWSPQETLGGSLLALDSLHDELRSRALQPLEPEDNTERQARCRRRDGTVIDLSFTVATVPGEAGHAGGVIVVASDITDRKRLEKALADRSEELARSNAELERFAYIASHDLQEPLRIVASYTQLLARRYKGRLDADADTFIAFAVDGVKRMQSLINDLLTYSRAGKGGSDFRPSDFGQALDVAINNLRMRVAEIGADVTSDPLPTVPADITQIVQLFQNLLSNALKFHASAPPHIHVGAQRVGAHWRFSVSDNGIGISAEHFDRIFVLFQRLHSQGDYPGTGIGLALCKKIVERHGGRIWPEARPGGGTTFHFTIAAHPPLDG